MKKSSQEQQQQQQQQQQQHEDRNGMRTQKRSPLVLANNNSLAPDISVGEQEKSAKSLNGNDARSVAAEFIGAVPKGNGAFAGLGCDPLKTQDDQSARGLLSRDSATEKRVVEFRNKRLYFQESKLQLDKLASTLTEIIAFREYCDANNVNIADATAVPDEYLPLLAKLVQDSEKALGPLAREIRSNLCPAGQAAKETSGGQISLQAIKRSIEQIASRIDYGVPLSAVEEMEQGAVAGIPPSLSLFRWEVTNVELFTDENLQQEILRRQRRRQLAAKQAADLFKSVDVAVRKEILTKVTRAKRGAELAPESAKKRAKEADAAEKAAEKARNAEEKARKAEEKARKAEEKNRKLEEKTAERERREMEKKAKADAQEARKAQEKAMRGQRSIAMFLTATPKQEQKAPKVSNPKLALMYERFPPFHIKTDVELAPPNRFEHTLAEGFEELFWLKEAHGQDSRRNFVQESAEELLKADLVEMKRCGEQHGLSEKKWTRGRRVLRQPDFRLLVQEGGVIDAKMPRSDLEAQGISVKLLQFAGDYRPPYWGTFTRGSSRLNFRAPFAKDPKMFDYDYDSEAEWEQDDEGEELMSEDDDDTRSQGEAAPAGEGEEDDDWLVPHGYLSEDEGMESDDETPKGTPGVSPNGKRKVERDRQQSRTRSAHVAQLVPFIVGPIFVDSCNAPSPDPYLNLLCWEVL